MKRFLLVMVLVVLTWCGITAQNANRNGFFLELGIGGLVGDTPRSSISITDNIMTYKCVAGTAADIGLGARFRIGNHWAYEFKLEGMVPLDDPINAVVGRFLPLGFRYTSGEIWKNYSIYAHADIGGAMTGMGGLVDSSNLDYSGLSSNNGRYGCIFPDTDEIKLLTKDIRAGAAFSVGLGVNLTTHLYIEACYNAQALFHCFGKRGYGRYDYGMTACVLGYRF